MGHCRPLSQFPENPLPSREGIFSTAWRAGKSYLQVRWPCDEPEFPGSTTEELLCCNLVNPQASGPQFIPPPLPLRTRLHQEEWSELKSRMQGAWSLRPQKAGSSPACEQSEGEKEYTRLPISECETHSGEYSERSIINGWASFGFPTLHERRSENSLVWEGCLCQRGRSYPQKIRPLKSVCSVPQIFTEAPVLCLKHHAEQGHVLLCSLEVSSPPPTCGEGQQQTNR